MSFRISTSWAAILGGAVLVCGAAGLSADEPPRYLLQSPGAVLLPGLAAPVAGVAAGDLDGDAVPDLVASMEGDPAALATFVATAPLQWPVPTILTAPFPGQVWTVDWDGDTLLDAFICSGPLEKGYRGVAQFRGKGDGTFHEPTVRLTGLFGDGPVATLFTDLDGDGHRDAILDGSGGRVYFGPGLPAPELLPLTGRSTHGLAILDVDLDGRDDILAGGEELRLFRQLNGRQFFGYALPVHLAEGFAPLDVDGDGTLEILGASLGKLAAVSLRREGGEWRATVRQLVDPAAPEAVIRRLVAGDFNGDQVEDVFGLQDPGEAFFLRGVRQLGVWSFERGDRIPLPGFPLYGALTTSELNGDGVLDVLLGRGYFLGRRGTSPAATRLAAEITAGLRVLAADIDLDGHEDLLQQVQTQGTLLELRKGGAAGLGEAVAVSSNTAPSNLAAGRLDETGPVSLFWGQDAIFRAEISPAGRLGPISRTQLADRAAESLTVLAPGSPGAGAALLAHLRLPGQRDYALARYGLPGGGGVEPAWEARVPRPYLAPQAADLDGDGLDDYLVAAIDGAHLLWGSPGGPADAAERASVPWESIDAMEALDLEGDGQPELVVARRADGLAHGVRRLRRAAPGRWEDAQVLPDSVAELIGGELSGDGRADLAALTTDQEVVICEGNGQGAFLSPRARASSVGERGLLAANLDGDDLPDLLTLRFDSLIAVFGQGEAVLQRHRDVASLATGVSSIHEGDFDADGALDLVINYEFGSDACLLGLGDGTFPDVRAIVDPEEAGSSAVMTTGDFTGDGRLDLASTSYQGTGIRLAPGKGDGTFERGGLLAGARQGTIGIDSGDIDGDGLADVLGSGGFPEAIVHRGGSQIAVASPTTFATGRVGLLLLLADLNGDARLDLAVGDASRTTAFAGDGKGGWLAGTAVPNLSVWPGEHLLGDLNGDGIADGVWSDGVRQSEVFLGSADLRFTRLATLQEAAPLALGDLDGDGDADLLAGRDVQSHFLWRGLGGGGFARPAIVPIPSFYKRLLDVDGDGLRDVLSARGNVLQATFAGSHPARWTTGAFGPIRARAVAAGSFDGKEPVGVAVFPGVGAEIEVYSLASHELVKVGESSALGVSIHQQSEHSMVAADLDGDGRRDLVISDGERVELLRGKGDNTFEPARLLARGLRGPDLRIVDLDGNGALDLFVSGFTVALAATPGELGSPLSYRNDDGSLSPVNAVADFDGDGALDVAQNPVSTGKVVFTPGDGQGRFGERAFFEAPGSVVTGVACGDFDGDRRKDLAVGASGYPESLPVAVWYGRGSRAFARGADLRDPLSPVETTGALLCRDLDGDEHDDLIRITRGGYALLHRGGPNGLEAAGAAAHAAAVPEAALLANFAGSAALDLLTVGESSGQSAPAHGVFLAIGELAAVDFQRGDADGDGRLAITDAIYVLRWLFLGGPGVACADAADANDDGAIALSDAVASLRFQFLDDPPLPPPFPACGSDPTGDPLDCLAFAPCP